MAIKSYLAHPHNGQKEKLQKELSTISQCEVIAADNKDVLVLVTETDSEPEEVLLKEQLFAIDSLKLLALVSGFNSPKNN